MAQQTGDETPREITSSSDVRGRPPFRKTLRGWEPLAFRLALLVLFSAASFSMGRRAGAVPKEQDILRAKAIEAESFQVCHPDGRRAAVLTTGPSGGVTLAFLSNRGNPQLVVGMDSKGTPTIAFLAEDGESRMDLSLDPVSQMPSVRLVDRDGGSNLVVGLDKIHGPGVQLSRLNRGSVSLNVSDIDGPSCTISDREGAPRIRLSVSASESVVELLGPKRVVRSVWKVAKDGSSAFRLSDGASKPRIELSTGADGRPFIRVLDSDGNLKKEWRE